MNKTFYIAGSSKDRELIAEFGEDLKAGQWQWEWDWTKVKEAHLSPAKGDSPALVTALGLARPGLVMHDLRAAAAADLFVLHLGCVNTSFGGACELGTRLQSGKKAHVVLNGAAHHLFLEHPSISVWDTWHDFLNVMGILELP
jgi:hypothetical protein